MRALTYWRVPAIPDAILKSPLRTMLPDYSGIMVVVEEPVECWRCQTMKCLFDIPTGRPEWMCSACALSGGGESR